MNADAYFEDAYYSLLAHAYTAIKLYCWGDVRLAIKGYYFIDLFLSNVFIPHFRQPSPIAAHTA